MTALTSVLHETGILTITIDIKKETMNVLNRAVMEEFSTLVDSIDQNAEVKAVIVTSGKKGCFIAGADINMLQQVESASDGSDIVSAAHELLQKISNSHKPFIAAIDGICLGAGLEMSLACHYRLATTSPTTKIGLPEIMLGLLPGATGTTKLSRLIPLPSALDLLLTGKQLDSKRAKRLGIIDEIVPANILLEVTGKAANKLINQQWQRKKPGLKQRLLCAPLIRDLILYKAKQAVLKKTRGLYPAPLSIIDVIKKGLGQSLSQALAYEAQKFGELTVTPEAKRLIEIYFASTELKKETFVNDKTIKPQAINKVGILGGGLMGAGIATVSIDKAKTSVRMKDIRDEGIMAAVKHISSYYGARVKRRILSKEHAKKKINQFTGTLDYSGFKNCDLVIEAVFEDITVKQQMVADIESLGNENTIFATNTSSLPLTSIAAKAERPENIIGMHYFSPVEKMPLLEIIKHSKTSEQTITTAVDFGRKQGKTVIVVNDGAGFYVNRILAPYMNAALEIGLMGVPFDTIDTVFLDVGFPVGPIKLLDEIGIDIANKIQPILEEAFGERMQGAGIQEKLINHKRLGKKVKKGFYSYAKASRLNAKKNTIDPEVYQELGINKQVDLPATMIAEYCLYRMLNEAALCLDEDIIQSPRDGDIGAIFGIGFPPFLGGPFRYMDTIGIDTLVAKLKNLESKHGNKYTPAPLLVNMAEDNKTFY